MANLENVRPLQAHSGGFFSLSFCENNGKSLPQTQNLCKIKSKGKKGMTVTVDSSNLNSFLITLAALRACKGSWLSIALGLAMMVPDVRKNLKPTQLYMLNNLCYNNFSQKSSPGGVLALGLLLAVYGPGLGPDGPGCLEKP